MLGLVGLHVTGLPDAVAADITTNESLWRMIDVNTWKCACGGLRDPMVPEIPHVRGGFCFEHTCASCWIQHMARSIKGE
jgi:hypothetical protein